MSEAKLAALLLILAPVSASACDRSTNSGQPASRASSTAPGAAPSAATSAPPTASASPSFTRDVLPYLQKNCAVTLGCHGDSPTDSVDLDLRPPAAYKALVQTDAMARPGGPRIHPGDPRRSFLVDKMNGTQGPKEGKAMPLDADTGAPLPITAAHRAFVERVLKAWISAGAPNN